VSAVESNELEALIEKRSRELSKKLEEFRKHEREKLAKELEKAAKGES
jgi:hypothetical protein